jgi:hypothetical protein
MEVGQVWQHVFYADIKVELLQRTRKGWKVKQYDKRNKSGKIAFFNIEDFIGNKFAAHALFKPAEK